MIHRLKRFAPAWFVDLYHRALSRLAALLYGCPSERMIVIGVTGTNGKTTTTYLIARALEASGFKTGCTTTAIFKVGEREWLNDTKMTMLGRFRLQKLLRDMADAGCRYAVVETSSQGIVQHRHQDINYDVAVFTNLTPEHIEAHGGFESYKQAKIELFRHTAASRRKTIAGMPIPKVAILNARDRHAQDFAVPGFDAVVRYGMNETPNADLVARDIELEPNESTFVVQDAPVHIRLPGMVNVENALAALSTASALGISLEKAAQRLAEVPGIPGRFERVDEGQPWTVLVDYAPEPESFARLYETLSSLTRERTIHVLGSAGGGRDVARRPVLGRMAAERADLVIVTNEDPYDDDPMQIMEQVAEGARQAGKRDGDDLLIIPDRQEAIFEAMRRAQENDLVVITGKGSEQAMMVAEGKRVPWDDRSVAREAIKAALK